jgi:membrane-bound lytic murein transglycosylase C
MLSPFSLFSQQFDDPLEGDFEQLDAMLDTQFRETDESLERKFLQVQQAVDAAYKGLTKKIEINWQSDIKLPGKSSWVTYDETFTSRGQFDFDKGVYQVETIVGKDVASSLLKLKAIAVGLATSSQQELKSKDVFNQEVNKQLNKSYDLVSSLVQESNSFQHINVMQILPINTESLITQVRLDNIEMQPSEMAIDPPITFKNRATEKGLLTTKLTSVDIVKETTSPEITSTLRIEETDEIVQEPVAPKIIPTLTIEETGDFRKLVLTIPFVNNFQKVLMESRLDTIRTMAKRFRIDVSLILAVIETESSFNPMATSNIPAFGLMQLVPKTAGIDSYQFVYGFQKVVSPEYLYNQENNLLLGTAYLHLLANRYLRNVSDEQSKLYCMLASYNTGVGNLAKTLINQKNLGKAVLKVNSMTSEQVYDHLMQYLPADETKNYLIKILRRKQKYLHLDLI